MLFDEPQAVHRQQFGRVAVFDLAFVVEPPVRVSGPIDMRVEIAIPSAKTSKKVEPVAAWQPRWQITQMPFAETGRRVPVVPKVFGNRHRIVR